MISKLQHSLIFQNVMSYCYAKTARRDKFEVYLHLIWTTWDRQLWIEPEWEEQMFALICQAVEQQQCFTIAFGGVQDHVHLLVAVHATTSISDLMKTIKGTSATFGRRHNPAFKWRGTYAAFSVSRWDLPKIKAYILNQKEHHASGTTKPALETADEEYEYWIEDMDAK